MAKRNFENQVKAHDAKKARKLILDEMSKKQSKINQYSPKARQILGHLLRMPADVQDEVKKGIKDVF